MSSTDEDGGSVGSESAKQVDKATSATPEENATIAGAKIGRIGMIIAALIGAAALITVAIMKSEATSSAPTANAPSASQLTPSSTLSRAPQVTSSPMTASPSCAVPPVSSADSTLEYRTRYKVSSGSFSAGGYMARSRQSRWCWSGMDSEECEWSGGFAGGRAKRGGDVGVPGQS
jgi:hypothetical protein